MTPYERFRARLAGKPVDRPPNFNIYMTFAAAHIGAPLRGYYTDHRVLVEANLAMVRDFQADIVQAISDPYREAADFGLAVEFPPNGLPLAKTPLLQNPAQAAGLRAPAPERGRRMSDRLEAIALFRRKVGGDVPIMGWVEGALAEAADLRGVSQLLGDLVARPEEVGGLLEACAANAVAFARAQMEAGADIIGLGDAVASQISPAMYRRFALPFEQCIFREVRRLGGVGRLHICGNVSHILPHMLQSGAGIIDIDHMVDWAGAVGLMGEAACPCGNFDPVGVMLQGTPRQVYEAAARCLAGGGPRCFSMAGCEIPPGTPHENLQAQNRAIRDHRAR